MVRETFAHGNSFRGLMNVIPAGLISLSLLFNVLTMVIWESIQCVWKEYCVECCLK